MKRESMKVSVYCTRSEVCNYGPRLGRLFSVQFRRTRLSASGGFCPLVMVDGSILHLAGVRMFRRCEDQYEDGHRDPRGRASTGPECIIVTPQAAKIGGAVACWATRTTTSASRHIHRSSRRRKRGGSTRTASGLRPLHLQDPGLHKSLESKIATSSGRTTRSSTRRASTPMAVSSRRSSAKRTRSSPDALNHASIIDSIPPLQGGRLIRYANRQPGGAREALKKRRTSGCAVATDGVFSMDSYLAKLDQIYVRREVQGDGHGRRLARSRFIGKTGRGTPGTSASRNRIDMMTSTLSKALGGASGSFTCGQGDRRAPPPALAPVSLLQLHPAGDREASITVLDSPLEHHRASRAARSERAPLPRGA